MRISSSWRVLRLVTERLRKHLLQYESYFPINPVVFSSRFLHILIERIRKRLLQYEHFFPVLPVIPSSRLLHNIPERLRKRLLHYGPVFSCPSRLLLNMLTERRRNRLLQHEPYFLINAIISSSRILHILTGRWRKRLLQYGLVLFFYSSCYFQFLTPTCAYWKTKNMFIAVWTYSIFLSIPSFPVQESYISSLEDEENVYCSTDKKYFPVHPAIP